MKKFKQNYNFSFKAVAGFVAVSVLISIFVPFSVAKAGNISCLSISKLGRNISTGSSWSETTNAEPSQKIAFSIKITAASNTWINSVNIDDVLSDKLTYISGSTKIDNVSASDGITGSGITIGSFNPGQSKTITLEANVADKSNFSEGETSLINTAGAWAVCATKVTDTAEVIVNKKGEEPINPNLSIEKLVRNISTGSGLLDSVDAEPADEVEFSINIRSTGNQTVINVRVWDNLPSRLAYISGTTSVDGSYRADGIVGAGIYIGDLNPGQNKIIKFRARVESSNLYYSATLTNYAYTQANDISSIYDTARVLVEEEREEPAIHIDKLVKNITRGSGYWTDTVYADPGDQVEFLIKVYSVGGSLARDVRVKDELPSKLEFVSNSTTVDSYPKSDAIIASNGLYIDDIQDGDYKEVRFKARVAEGGFPSSLVTLTNEASAWATGVTKVRDYAYVKVQEGEGEVSAISINKLVRNISRGESTWLDSVLASPSQEVEFSIQIVNIGNSDLRNVKVWDILPDKLSIISNSTTVDGANIGGDVTGAGLNLGTLSPGAARTIKFRAVLANEDEFGTGSIGLINTAYTKADNASQVSDTARIGGEVKGAEFPPTGASTFVLIFLAIISALISLFLYCRAREEKLLDILNSQRTNRFIKGFIKFYFRIKFFWQVTKLRFKKIYW